MMFGLLAGVACWVFSMAQAPLPEAPLPSEQELEGLEQTRRHERSRAEGDVPAELSSWLFADALRRRAQLANAGYSLEVFLTVDASAHPSGGADPDSTALRGLADVIVSVDTERAFGLAGGELALGLQALGGEDGSAAVGVAQNYSNIDADDDRVQLGFLWYQQELFAGRTRLRLGKMDANSLFAGVPTAARFLHSSMGYSPTILGLPTYPDPSYGLAARQRLTPTLDLRIGVFDGAAQEGVKTGEKGPKTLFGEPSDLFWIGQAEWTWAARGARAGRLGVGAWRHTGDFERFDGGSDDGTGGLYALLEQSAVVAERPWHAFLQLGEADEDVAPITRHVGFGLSASAIFLPERDDALGAGVSRAKLSSEAGAGFSEHSETALEVFYGFQLVPGVRLKPDLQYVRNPGGDASLGDAWIFTLRVSVFL